MQADFVNVPFEIISANVMKYVIKTGFSDKETNEGCEKTLS